MAAQPPIERALFREAEDGTTVYFPWGLSRQGYRLADSAAKEHASRAASLLIGATVAIGTWTAHALQPLLQSESADAGAVLSGLAGPAAAMAVTLLAYGLWVWRFIEDCPESDLRLPREQRLREAAELAEPRKIALIGAGVCSMSGLLIWLEPHAWWLGLLGIATGLGLLYWSSLLRKAVPHRPS